MKLRGLRKWSIVVLTLVLAYALAHEEKLTAEFATIATSIVVAFVGANAYTHHAQASDTPERKP